VDERNAVHSRLGASDPGAPPLRCPHSCRSPLAAMLNFREKRSNQQELTKLAGTPGRWPTRVG